MTPTLDPEQLRAAGRVPVAVGLVWHPDGRLLMASRAGSRPYAGWWEFPGGKIERGESAPQALARELHEELGLVLDPSAVRLEFLLEHDYAHAQVSLFFCSWTLQGAAPQAREEQQWVWSRPEGPWPCPILPATWPALERLAGRSPQSSQSVSSKFRSP